MMKIIVLDGIYHILFENATITTSFYDRFIGLMGKKKIEANEALCLRPCNSIHTLFMRFSIDVIFIDLSNKVIGLIENLKPWKLTKTVKTGVMVIEMPSGSIKDKNIKLNDTIFLLQS